MLPSLDHPQWKEILTGKTLHNFRCVPAGLMFSRLRRELEKDGSPATYTRCLDEAYAFFQKYEKILADDIAALFH